MEDCLDKEYVLVSMENFDDYLVFMGINYMTRQLAKKMKPIHILRRNKDGTYTFISIFKRKVVSSEATFTPGKEFLETKADGVKVRALITIEGNVMTHTQVESNGRTSKHVREFHADKLIVTTTGIGLDKAVTTIFESTT